MLILSLLVIFTSCEGSSGILVHKPTEILLDFPDPQVSFSLSASDYEYQLVIYSSIDLLDKPLFGPALLASYNTDTNTYSVRADDLLFGEYYAEIWLVKKAVKEEELSLPISKASFSINIQNVLEKIGLSDLTWDDNSFDEDNDGLKNSSEINLGTNPRDVDSDKDGVSDGIDAFPLNSLEAYDFDGDGIGDVQDSDIDNDGLLNVREGEIGTDPILPDTDLDTHLDGKDNCPVTSNENQEDTDKDGIGDLCDEDIDGDGLSNIAEDKIGTNKKLSDTDGDGILDQADVFPKDKTEANDHDNDGIGDNKDSDDDNDGLSDLEELAKGSNPISDDSDNDGIKDKIDNCILLPNPGQNDNELDGLGDLCDDNDDNDFLLDSEEIAIGTDGFISNPLVADTDGDGFKDGQDNCPNDDNITQLDVDSDRFGAACDCDDHDVDINQLAFDLPDPRMIDRNCDGIDGDRYNSIFVSVNGTNQASNTKYGSPTSDLQGAIYEAFTSGKAVLVSKGDYNIKNLVIKDRVYIYGGFSETFLERDTLSLNHETKFISSEPNSNGSILNLTDLKQGITIGGITLLNNSDESSHVGVFIKGSKVSFENCEFSGSQALAEYLIVADESYLFINGSRFYGGALGNSTGLFVENSELNVINSLFVMGDSDHTRAIEINNTDAILSNNTIDGGRHPFGSSFGVIFENSSPIIINNIFITQSDRNQASLVCSGLRPNAEIELSNNAFLRLTSRTINYPAYIQCDGSSLRENSELESSSELNAQDNLVELVTSETILQSYVDVTNFYTPKPSSPLINAGQNTDSENRGAVSYDLKGQIRHLDEFDIGAVEKE